eukprot:6492614-Amphidinium_carterae.2
MFYKAKLEAYLKDLPSYVEHASQVEHHKTALMALTVDDCAQTQVLAEALHLLPTWQQKLREATVEPMQALLLEKIKMVIKHALSNDVLELCSSLDPIVADASIAFSHDVNIPDLRRELGKKLQVNKQAMAAGRLAEHVQELTKKVNNKEHSIEDRAATLQSCIDQAGIVIPSAVPEAVTVAVRSCVGATIELLMSAINQEDGHIEVSMCIAWCKVVAGFLHEPHYKRVFECCDLAVHVMNQQGKGKTLEGVDLASSLQSEQALVLRLISACGSVKGSDTAAEEIKTWLQPFSSYANLVCSNASLALEKLHEDCAADVKAQLESISGEVKHAAEQWKETAKKKYEQVMSDVQSTILKMDACALNEKYERSGAKLLAGLAQAFKCWQSTLAATKKADDGNLAIEYEQVSQDTFLVINVGRGVLALHAEKNPAKLRASLLPVAKVIKNIHGKDGMKVMLGQSIYAKVQGVVDGK